MNLGVDRDKILVVDDNPENIWSLIEGLEDQYEVRFATNGEKALEIAFSEDQPDLILLDIMMPGMDGYEICASLKANVKTRGIPVIFVTASEQQEDETKGFRLGAVDFISKPFRMPVVEARIKAALRLKEEMDDRMVLTKKLEDLNRDLEERIKEKTGELEQAYENLKASERKYRTIYENAIEGIFQTSPDGRLLSASPSLARTLGYESSADLLGAVSNTARQLYVKSEDRSEFRRMLEEKGSVSGFETQFRKKNGDIIDVMISAKVICDERNNPLHYQGFNIDITEQKRAKELELANIRLKELDALKTALMSTASHDMRSPLTSILGFTDLIHVVFSRVFSPLAKGDGNLQENADKILDYLRIIEEEGERLIRLVNDFLDLSKFESGCSEWHDSPVQMAEIIDLAVRATKGQLLAKPELALEISCDHGLPVLMCDPDRLMQIMVNLLSNAAKFTEKGSISVHATPTPTKDMVVVRVADTGLGVPPEEQDKIFHKFYQLGQCGPSSSGSKGTGLGLAICKQIVEHYGGRIWVESDWGHGSTFVFQLPARRAIRNG